MKKFLIYITLLAGILSLSSCLQDTDDIFDDSASNRVTKAIAKYDALLKSKEKGWIVEYFPQMNQKWGGFTLHMVFNEDNTVTMASNISMTQPERTKGEKRSTSMYTLSGGEGPMISFDTYNSVLHFFSDPDLVDEGGGGQAEAYNGDYEFTFYEGSEDEILIRGRKSNGYSIMRPYPEGLDFQAFCDKIRISQLGLGEVYEVYVNNNLEGKAVFDYSANQIALTIEEVTTNVPFLVSEESVKTYFKKPMKIGDALVEELHIDNLLLLQSADKTIEFRAVEQNGYEQLMIIGDTWFFDLENSSPDVKANHESVEAAIKANYNPDPNFRDVYSTVYKYFGRNESTGYGNFHFIWRVAAPSSTGYKIDERLYILNITGNKDSDNIIFRYTGYSNDTNGALLGSGGSEFFNLITNGARQDVPYTLSSVSKIRASDVKFTKTSSPSTYFYMSKKVKNLYKE